MHAISTKRHNTLFTIATLLILSSILGYLAYTELPEGVARAAQSELEARVYQPLPEMTAQTLASKQFQAQTEQYISDATPAKDNVLVAHATIQRLAIELANIICQQGAYHTFYGSDYVVLPAYDAVTCMTSTQEDFPKKLFKQTCKPLSTLISRTENSVSWAYFLPDNCAITTALPTHGLASGSLLDYPTVRQWIEELLPDSCVFVDGSYSNPQDYYQKFFRSDHHFQIQGAIDFYQALITAFGMDPIDFADPYLTNAGSFVGSNGRSGLIAKYQDAIFDVSYAQSNLIVKSNGNPVNLYDIDKQYLPDPSAFKRTSTFENLYVSWFHGDPGLLEYENLDLNEEAGSLLLISDSYDSSSDRFFAEHYRHVYEIDPRYYQGNVQEFIEEHGDIKDAAIVLIPYSFKLIQQNAGISFTR